MGGRYYGRPAQSAKSRFSPRVGRNKVWPAIRWQHSGVDGLTDGRRTAFSDDELLLRKCLATIAETLASDEVVLHC